MKKVLFFTASLFFILAIFIFINFKASAHEVVSTVQMSYFQYASKDMNVLETEHFEIKYNHNKQEADMVEATAEKYYDALSRLYDYEADGKISIIIHDDVEEMKKFVFMRSDSVPMGLYIGKTIHILSPSIWIESKENIEEIFEKHGPIIHEMSHYMVDDLTQGNYDTWFFEGVALYTEYLYTGYTIGSNYNYDTIYSIEEMEKNFHKLDKIKAYYSSFMHIKALVEENNLEYLNYMIKCLDEGQYVQELY